MIIHANKPYELRSLFLITPCWKMLNVPNISDTDILSVHDFFFSLLNFSSFQYCACVWVIQMVTFYLNNGRAAAAAACIAFNYHLAYCPVYLTTQKSINFYYFHLMIMIFYTWKKKRLFGELIHAHGYFILSYTHFKCLCIYSFNVSVNLM